MFTGKYRNIHFSYMLSLFFYLFLTILELFATFFLFIYLFINNKKFIQNQTHQQHVVRVRDMENMCPMAEVKNREESFYLTIYIQEHRIKSLTKMGLFASDNYTVECYVCGHRNPVLSGDDAIFHTSRCWFPRVRDFQKQHSEKVFESFDHLKFEASRICTFIDWPVPRLNPFDLAATGLFYLRDSDRCMCIFCFEIWRANDDEHHCRNVSGNISIQSFLILKSHKTDILVQHKPRGRERFHFYNEWSQVTKNSYFNQIGRRMSTFEDHSWPLPDCCAELAKAGFIYTGLSDHVKCFMCGLSLHNFYYSDDKTALHFLHSPQCEFLSRSHGVPEKQFPLIPVPQPYEQLNQIQGQIYKYSDKDLNFLLNDIEQFENIPKSIIKKVLKNKLQLDGMLFVDGEEYRRQVCKMMDVLEQEKDYYTFPNSPTNDDLKEFYQCSLCKICNCSIADLIFMPCQHVVICQKCFDNGESSRRCPVHNCIIDDSIRLIYP